MKNFIVKNKKSGFTLIELLVVVAIIGILSSIVFSSLNAARFKTRDARRRMDLKQIQIALELYYNTNGSYPATGGAWWGNCLDFGSHGTSGANGWIPNLAPASMPILPLDPKPNGTFGCYIYNGDGANYKVLAYQTMESTCPVSSTDSMYDPVRGGCTIAIYTQGGINF